MRLTFLFIIFFAQQALGQSPLLDSLLQLLGTSKKADTAFVNTLNETGTVYWKQGEDSLAKTCHNRAISAAEKIDYTRGEGNARLQLVRMELEHLEDVAGMHNQIDTVLVMAKKHKDEWLEGMAVFRKAQIYTMGFYEYKDTIPILFERARRLFVATNDMAMEGSVYAELASVEANEGRFAAAVDYLQKARKLQERTGNKAALRATLPNLGAMYVNLQMFDDALAIFDLAEKNARDLQDVRVLAYIAYQKGDIYRRRKKYDSAMTAYKFAADVYTDAGAIQLSTNLYARIAHIYLLQHKPDSAIIMNNYADSLYFANVDIDEAFFHHTVMNNALIHLYKKNYDKAIYYAQMGVDTLKNEETVLADELKSYYDILAEAYEAKGDYRKALYSYKQFKAWSDTLINDETNQRALTASLTYDFEKKQQLSQLELQQTKEQHLVLMRNLLIALLLMAIVLVIYAMYNNARLKGKNKELREKNAEIARALDKGQRIERKRIASELHDNLNTQVAAIKWYVEAMDTDPMSDINRKLHSKLLGISHNLYQDLRLISHLMLPAALEKDGLAGALKAMLQKVNETSQTQFLLFYESVDDLPENTNHQLYNIAMELINNVLKHAEAEKAILRVVQTENDSILLQTEDNGKGIANEILSGGIGLDNIAGRAQALGGNLSWKNNLEGGATVTIVVPLQQAIV